MKKHFFLVFALFLAMASACTGTRLRNQAMSVYVTTMSQVIVPHIERGIISRKLSSSEASLARATTLGLKSALGSGDRMSLLPFVPRWKSMLRPLYVAGLNARLKAGELGPVGVRRFIETADRFGIGLLLLTRR